MGNCCCRIRNPRRQIVILLLGLDNAGKTVAVQNLAGERTQSVMPTVGFSIVDLKYAKYDIKVFDLGGRADFRDVWQRYYVDAHGIIYVVDASDYSRIDEAQEVLERLITTPKVQGKPVLLLANKQDNERALDEIELIDKLQLEKLANENESPTFITSCCAQNDSTKLDKGIKIGYNWLVKSIIADYAKLDARVQEDVITQKKFDEDERKERFLRIRALNEQEAIENNIKVTTVTNSTEKQNGVVENGVVNNGIHDIFVVDHKAEECSSSTSSALNSPIYSIKLADEPETSRPESATSLIRKQLELGNLKRRPSLPLRHNKTAPVNLFGIKTKAVRSATVRPCESPRKTPDRRHLRSAGDSIFIVTQNPVQQHRNHDGSGDLTMFNVRKTPQNRAPLTIVKDFLPPITDIHSQRLPNGTYF